MLFFCSGYSIEAGYHKDQPGSQASAIENCRSVSNVPEAHVSSPQRGTLHHTDTHNLLSVLALDRVRQAYPQWGRVRIFTPFFTNHKVVDQLVENHRCGVPQEVYVHPCAANPQHGKSCLDRLQKEGILTYIVPGLHAKSAEIVYFDAHASRHTRSIIGTSNMTYAGLFHNVDSLMVLSEEMHSDMQRCWSSIAAQAYLYQADQSGVHAQGKKNVSPRRIVPQTPRKRVLHTHEYDVMDRIVRSINNTKIGDRINVSAFALDEDRCINALQDACQRGVTCHLYVDNATKLPDVLSHMPVHVVPSRKLYHDKTISIVREAAPSTVYYTTGNHTYRSQRDHNMCFVTQSPNTVAHITEAQQYAISRQIDKWQKRRDHTRKHQPYSHRPGRIAKQRHDKQSIDRVRRQLYMQ